VDVDDDTHRHPEMALGDVAVALLVDAEEA
jgi:hypothetical protein